MNQFAGLGRVALRNLNSTPDGQSCIGCRFYMPAPPEPGNLKAPPVGGCRRFPPTVNLVIAGMTPQGPNYAPACCYPSVNPQDWCGEWETNLKSS